MQATEDAFESDIRVWCERTGNGLDSLEAVKYLAGMGELAVGRIFTYDALYGDFDEIELAGRKPDCAVCGDHPTITELTEYGAPACRA